MTIMMMIVIRISAQQNGQQLSTEEKMRKKIWLHIKDDHDDVDDDDNGNVN